MDVEWQTVTVECSAAVWTESDVTIQQHLPIPKTPADVKEVIEKKCVNSSVVILERILRPEEGRVDLESLEGKIKSMNQFVFVFTSTLPPCVAQSTNGVYI